MNKQRKGKNVKSKKKRDKKRGKTSKIALTFALRRVNDERRRAGFVRRSPVTISPSSPIEIGEWRENYPAYCKKTQKMPSQEERSECPGTTNMHEQSAIAFKTSFRDARPILMNEIRNYKN